MKKDVFKILGVALVAIMFLTSCGKDEVIKEEVTNELGGSLGTRTLYADTIYIIDRFARVDSGDLLTIQPGTIVKFKTGTGPDASALIIARGGKINAIGTAEKPIILTSVNDKIAIGETLSTLSTDSKGLWGGLIILGYAPVSALNGNTVSVIEGVPSTYAFSKYGGDDEDDNSGSLQFVSIRYTGSELVPDQEIQGLTLGGVGRGTVISDIEIISSDDDGVEFFGGTVNVSNLLVAFQSDDAIDIDQNYAGTITNALALVNNASAGNDALELDGPENTTYNEGKFTISSSTFINISGNSRAGTLKSGAQGTISDCVFKNFNNGFTIDGSSATNHYNDGDLEIINSEFNTSGSVEDFIAGSALSTEIKALFAAAGNEKLAVSEFTKGATLTDFSWTWAKQLNLF